MGHSPSPDHVTNTGESIKNPQRDCKGSWERLTADSGYQGGIIHYLDEVRPDQTLCCAHFPNI